jgi:hypothetical protein
MRDEMEKCVAKKGSPVSRYIQDIRKRWGFDSILARPVSLGVGLLSQAVSAIIRGGGMCRREFISSSLPPHHKPRCPLVHGHGPIFTDI